MSEGKELLAYYQDKVDQLYKERLMWLSKFDQCNTLLKQKQKLMDQLKQHKDKQLDLNRGIVHHDVVLLDQKLNVVKMQRDNIMNEYADAEQILKMQELVEQYPQQLEKHLPCKILVNGTEIIDNELNIHAASKLSKKNNFSIFRESNSVLSGVSGGAEKEKQKIKYKPSKQELIKKQIIDLKTNQEKEICLLKQQKRKIQDLLRSARDKEQQTLLNERDIVQKLKNQYKKLQQRHKNLSQKYFDCRKKLKQEHYEAKEEGQKLKETLNVLQKKVNQEVRIYEKENKAKQTLILRKSEDFQEDYKVKMRAKEHNLQALRDNYEKMQEVCIEKIRKLEETLTTAKHRLNQTEQRREQEISQLKKQLFGLQKQVGEERAEKARIDEQMRHKIQEDKRRRLTLQEKQEQQRRKFEKSKKILQAYKTTTKIQKPIKAKKNQTSKSGGKRVHQKKEENSQQQSDEQSMAMSDLQNINQQINKLSNKLEDKLKKNK